VIAATARTGPPPKGGWRHRVWPVSPLAGLVEESTAGFVERVNGTRRRRRRPQRLRARVVSWGPSRLAHSRHGGCAETTLI